MSAFVAAQRSAVLEAIERSGAAPEAAEAAPGKRPAAKGDEEDAEAYHALFVELAAAEGDAAARRVARQEDDAKRQRDAIGRRLAKRRASSLAAARKPLPVSATSQALARLKGGPPKTTDLVAQIEEARRANAVSHQLHTKRQHRHLQVKAAPAPLWGSGHADRADLAQAPGRTSVRQGMGFSSSGSFKPPSKTPKRDAGPGWG